MTEREFTLWSHFRQKYGPLNPVRMYDRGSALIATQINNAHGGKAKPIDFMPYGRQEEEDIEVGEDGFIAALGKGAKIGR